MSSPSEDENSDSNTEFKVNNEYAKNYNTWRQKEQLNKLKQRYGEEACNLENLSDDSSDTSDDDDEVDVSEKFEDEFLKVLALLKSKDPKIYDDKVSFFNETKESVDQGEEQKKNKSKKEKAVTLRDFERKIILERGGKYSDSEDENEPKVRQENGLTYVQEQNEIKNSFKSALEDDGEDDDLLVVKDKSEEQIKKEETRKKWLKGKEVNVDPKDEVLKPIRDFWANPNLDAGEKFLRDYILDKKYMDKNSSDADLDYDHMAHDSDENLSEDEQNVERQEEFEYKYNFRFEEPDQDFIKRYPRTLENSVRKKDTRRSEKRADLKKRKEDEKLQKKEALKELKALKRKEIEEKLEKLKEITGNDDIGISMADLEDDFDPNEYDKKMQNMFNDEYYTMPEDNAKPQFPEIDEEINADFNNFRDKYEGEDDYYEEPDCEDPNFIMDADYDPSADAKSKREDSSKKKKKGRSKNIELVKEKPKFDPELHSTVQEHVDRYYALDYEDMIGDMPCRFKHRSSVPNNYGLTWEEIMFADDKELNKWFSLKKALECKPEHVQKNEVLKFQQKAKNEALKRKILKSFYSPNEEEEENQEATTSTEQTKKRKKKKKKKALENAVLNSEKPSSSKENSMSEISEEVSLNSQKRKHSDMAIEENKDDVPKKKKKNNSEGKLNTNVPSTLDNQSQEVPKKKKNKGNQQDNLNDSRREIVSELQNKIVANNEVKKKKKKKVNNNAGSLNESVQNEIGEKVGNKETLNEKVNEQKKQKNKKQENNVVNNEMRVESGKEENTEVKSGKYEKLLRKKEIRKKKLEKKQKYVKLKNKLAKKESKGKPLDELASLGGDRLRAFGTNPKKFKNRLKYGNKS